MRRSVSRSTSHRHGSRAGAVLALVVACTLSTSTAAFAVPDGADSARDKVVLGETGTPQPLSNADQNPGGANNGGDCGAYCSTRDGSPAENGQGASGHEAGSKGAADNKLPPGQAPDGTDKNNGYECDGNNGIGMGNPAHTGCATTPPPPPAPPVRCVKGDKVTVGWAGVELGNPRYRPLVERAKTAAALLPGQYSVTLTSSDHLHRPHFQTTQTREQWYVALTLNGSRVATTRAIADLRDASRTMTQKVGTVTLEQGADTAAATHLLAWTQWGPSAQSIEPTQAVFTCV